MFSTILNIRADAIQPPTFSSDISEKMSHLFNPFHIFHNHSTWSNHGIKGRFTSSEKFFGPTTPFNLRIEDFQGLKVDTK
jgi:hypothetical protein